MKEGTPEYRKNLADELREINSIDKEVAHELLDEASKTPEYQDARKDKLDTRNEEKKEAEKQEKIAKAKAKILEMKEGKKAPEKPMILKEENPEYKEVKNAPEKPMILKEENPEYKEVKKAPEKPRILQAENKENINESPDKAILAMLSVKGEYNKEFPMYLQDAERMQEMTKQFSETIEGIKAKFREEYAKGLTVQDFYNKYNFFTDKEKGSQGLSINAPYLYGSKEKPWNQVLEKLGVKERPKHVKGSGYDLKGNVGYISMGLSSDYKYLDHSRKFNPLGLFPDKKKGVQKERSILSESAQIALAKKFGIIEPYYNGPLLQHPNFGGGELNRVDNEYYYTKNISVANIPGVIVKIYENKNHKQEHHPEAKGIDLNLSREFFDEVLKREMSN